MSCQGIEGIISGDELDESIFSDNTPIHKVDNDTLMIIFSYLNHAERVRLERVCRRWQSVGWNSWSLSKYLSLNGSEWGLSPKMCSQFIDVIILKKVLMRCGRFLTVLDLNPVEYGQTSDTVLKIVAKYCPHILDIDVHGFKLSSSGLFSLTMKCQNISHFTLGSLAEECEEALAQFFSINRNLKFLRIYGGRGICGISLRFLPSNVIKTIRLYDCSFIESPHLNEALEKFQRLHTLHIKDCGKLNDSSLEVIGKIMTLKRLYFGGSKLQVSPYAMYHIANLVNLVELNLNQNGAVTEELIIYICKKLKKLKSLNVNEVDAVTDKIISSLFKLKVFDCAGCYGISDAGIITMIEMAPKLSILDLGFTDRNIHKIIEAAIESTERRTHNIILTLYIHCDLIDVIDTPENGMVAPLLQLKGVECRH